MDGDTKTIVDSVTSLYLNQYERYTCYYTGVNRAMLIQFDNTVALCKVQTKTDHAAYIFLRAALKTMAPSARYMYTHKLWLKTKGKQGWDGKTSVLTKLHPLNRSGSFPTGLLPTVFERFSQQGIHPDLQDLRHKPLVTQGTPKVKLRDYQESALVMGLSNKLGGFDWPCGVFKIATGGGKTELAVALYESNPVPTVFIVHRKHLITQARERFKKYGIDTGQIGDSVFDPHPNGITVATIQTITRLLKANDPQKLRQFMFAGQIFFDEAHLCASKITGGNQFIAVSRQFRQAYYRWGLTATPFMKDEYSNQLLMGATGDLLCTISNAQLIEAGHLTPPRVVIIKVPEVIGPKGWPDVYDRAIVLNIIRNNMVINELIKAPKPALVMTNRIGHAKILCNLANLKGINLPAIVQGSTSNNQRAKLLKDLRSGRIDAIIATTVFDDGLDLPELATLVLAGGGKSTVAQLQRIGRGLRRAKGKKEVLVIDFKDMSGTILKKHSAARKKVWKDEGFSIEER